MKIKYFTSTEDYEKWLEKITETGYITDYPVLIQDRERLCFDFETNCKRWQTVINRARKIVVKAVITNVTKECLQGWLDCIEECAENGYFTQTEPGNWGYGLEDTTGEGNWYLWINDLTWEK